MNQLYKEAIRNFSRKYKSFRSGKLTEPTAVVLATASKKGRPSARVVLLKSYSERGFVFFTNFNSRKGRELRENPFAALCFYWDQFSNDQIRIEGKVHKVSEANANAYWKTRPRDSQLGAWASAQSESIPSRAALLQSVAKYMELYKNRSIPRPAHWGGFCLVPDNIEFWKRSPFRLHERILYKRTGGKWKRLMLYP